MRVKLTAFGAMRSPKRKGISPAKEFVRERANKKMRMCSIASGSSGNCIYVGTANTHVLIDAGISGKRVEEGLKKLGVTGKELDGILVTHEHSDHIQGLGVLARKYHVPLYMTGGTADWIQRNSAIGRVEKESFVEIREDEPFQIKDLQIEAFTIPHDAAQPVAYRLSDGKKSAAVATDMGKYSTYIIDHLRNLDAMLIESNHDLNMLMVGRYPYPLKLRIMGDRGHLSNESAGKLLGEVLHDHIRYVLLGHLSKDNNYEELALETVCQEVTMGDNPYQAKDFDIRIARRDVPSEILEF